MGRREGGREFWVVRSLFDFIDGWIGGCGMNKDLQYAAVFAPAAGFQARRLLVVTDGWWMVAGGWWMVVDGGRWTVDGYQKGSQILLYFFFR